MLNPIGFWSYSRADDSLSRGRLSQLRTSVAAELQAQIGSRLEVSIFQDITTVHPGTEWENEISLGLAASFFLIPILTPALVQSQWCCREILLFRQREATVLNRNDLIFPVHYLDILNTEDAYDPDVLKLLHSRQWIDFRGLRHKNVESEEVALKIEQIAQAICSALRRPKRNPESKAPQEVMAASNLEAEKLLPGKKSEIVSAERPRPERRKTSTRREPSQPPQRRRTSTKDRLSYDDIQNNIISYFSLHLSIGETGPVRPTTNLKNRFDLDKSDWRELAQHLSDLDWMKQLSVKIHAREMDGAHTPMELTKIIWDKLSPTPRRYGSAPWSEL
jgi:TIR domain